MSFLRIRNQLVFTDLCCVVGEQLHTPDVASGKSLLTARVESMSADGHLGREMLLNPVFASID